MNPKTQAKPRKDIYYVAVDVDLVALDTLTPWLEHYGLTLEDMPKPKEGELWTDYSKVIAEHPKAKPSDKYHRPHDFWRDGSIYREAQPTSGFKEFLQALKTFVEDNSDKEVRFFFCSTCIPSHKTEKEFSVNCHYGDIVTGGFVDTSCKYLVDFDLLIDDSVLQGLSAIEAGKRVLLSPGPGVNLDEIALGSPFETAIGHMTVLGDDKQHNSYGTWYPWFNCLRSEYKQEILAEITGFETGADE